MYQKMKRGSSSPLVTQALKRPDGSFTATAEESVELIINALIPSIPQDATLVQPPASPRPFEQRPCSLSEIKNALWRTPIKKTPGPDNIPATVLRCAWPFISEILLDLFNRCLRVGIFPLCWRKAEVISIRKSSDNDPTIPKSYRPVSLLLILGKTLERVVC